MRKVNPCLKGLFCKLTMVYIFDNTFPSGGRSISTTLSRSSVKLLKKGGCGKINCLKVSFNIGIFAQKGHTIKSLSTVTRNERSILWSAKVTTESLQTHITPEQFVVNSRHRPSLETDNQLANEVQIIMMVQ